MTIEFLGGSRPIQKNAINDHLGSDLLQMVFNYAIDHYELPRHSFDDRDEMYFAFENAFKANWGRDILTHEKVAKRFIKLVEAHVDSDGMNTFSTAIAKMNDDGVLRYRLETGQRLSKFDKLFNDRLVKVFNPLLNTWANDAALLLEEILEAQRQVRQEARSFRF